MATIEKRAGTDGTQYRVKLRLRGYPPASATFDRLTDAKRWAAETEASIRAGRYFAQAEARRHTVAEAVERYITETLPASSVTEGMKKDTARYLRWWTEQVGHLTLADLTPVVIREQRDGLRNRITQHGKPASAALVNRHLAALSVMLSTIVKDWGWLDDSPMRKVDKLTEPRGRTRFLSDEERDALLQACEPGSALHAIVVVALCTGARRGEILGLRWGDVDLIRERVIFRDTKNGETRAVPLVGPALDVVKDRSKVRQIGNDYVFPGAPGKPLEITRPFERARIRAGLDDFTFHDLRHSAASWLAMNGATLAEIAEILGHKTLAMVKRYSHLTEGHTRGVLERMVASKLA